MLGHRFTLVTSALLTVIASVGGPANPAASDGCRALADSILGFSGADEASSPWSGPESRRSVRRLADAASGDTHAYTSKCLLSAADTVARKAVDENPSSVDRRYALAVVLGLQADREGGRAKVRAAAALYDQLKAILAMDPEHVGAHHLMGRLQAGVMRMDRVTRWLATHLLGGSVLAGASWSAAEQNLAYAVAEAPAVPDYRFELAHLYEDTGRPGMALEEARQVLAMDPSAALEPTVHAKAAALVARIEAAGAR
jgi:tetratricopeptide (TPR) repeat protein